VGIYSVAVFNAAGSAISANAATALTSYQIANQMVAYWPFDQKTGTNAPNSVTGGQPVDLLGTVGWTNGEVSNAVAFDGTTTYGYVPSYTLATNAMTVATWFNATFPFNVTGPEDLVRNMQGNWPISGGQVNFFGQFGLELLLDATTSALQPTAYLGLGTQAAVAAAPVSDEITNSGWHHVAFTADGAQLTLFLDGTNVSQVPYSGVIDPAPSQPWLSVGCRLVTDTNTTPFPVDLDSTSGTDQVYGGLDDMAIWIRALTASEIGAIYQAGLQGKPLTSVTESAPVAGPKLSASVSNGNLVISWAPSGGRLESATALKSPISWTVVGTANPATVAIGKTNTFFRVISP